MRYRLSRAECLLGSHRIRRQIEIESSRGNVGIDAGYDAGAIDRRSPMASSNARNVRNSGLPLPESVR